MAIIYKNKNKIFKIRRKNINWLQKQTPIHINIPLSINSFIWSTLFKHPIKKINMLPSLYFNYVNIYSDMLFKNNFIFEGKNLFLYLYTNYCNKIITNRFKQQKTEQTLNLIVIASPQTQLFFTLSKNKPFLIFTNGVIRVVMQLIDKCSKKKKIVILNGIKFMWNSAIANFDGMVKLKFKKNFYYIRSVFNKNFEEAKIVDYILFEPKINFGFKDLNKRASIKKKLRKKKKYTSE